MLKVFLYDIIPSQNKGEAAILIGLRKWLSRISADHRMTIVSRADDYEHDRGNYSGLVDAIVEVPGKHDPRRRIEKAKLLGDLYRCLLQAKVTRRPASPSSPRARAMVEADLILYGHDNIVASGGFSAAIYLVALYCRLVGKPLVFCMGSIGPFRQPWKRLLARACVDRFSLVLLRDRPSFEFVRSLGAEMGRVRLTADPAFLMEPCAREHVEPLYREIGFAPREESIVGIALAENVVQTLYPELGTPEERSARFVEQFVSALGRFLRDTPGARALFIPHSYGPAANQDDRRFLQRILAALPPEARDRVHAIQGEPRPEELKRVIGDLDLFVSMRTHGLIAALSMGVPTLALSLRDRHKTNGIVADLFGLPEWVFHCEGFDGAAFAARLGEAWTARQAIRDHLAGKGEQVNEDLLATAEEITGLLAP